MVREPRTRSPGPKQGRGFPHCAVAAARHVAEHPVEANRRLLAVSGRPRQAREGTRVAADSQQRLRGHPPHAAQQQLQPRELQVVHRQQPRRDGAGLGRQGVEQLHGLGARRRAELQHPVLRLHAQGQHRQHGGALLPADGGPSLQGEQRLVQGGIALPAGGQRTGPSQAVSAGAPGHRLGLPGLQASKEGGRLRTHGACGGLKAEGWRQGCAEQVHAALPVLVPTKPLRSVVGLEGFAASLDGLNLGRHLAAAFGTPWTRWR
mmetsp:Transcript_39238/g.117240  ORF Transcript_39238/g.117240 Transcript_39238/m.117240 type:complete len:263 (-) Transcript_39238:307-1095(-)